MKVREEEIEEIKKVLQIFSRMCLVNMSDISRHYTCISYPSFQVCWHRKKFNKPIPWMIEHAEMQLFFNIKSIHYICFT